MGETDGTAPGRARRSRPARVGRTGARFPRPAEDEPDAGPGVDGTAAGEIGPETGSEIGSATGPELTAPSDELVGRTGARFNSRSRRARREAERQAAEDAAVPVQAPRPPRSGPQPPLDDAPTQPLFVPPADVAESTRTRVRPYVRTRGRTQTRADLAVETLVSIPTPRPPLEDPEHVALGDVVAAPRSVAEVAALLEVPLGVARVIIDDMAGAGLLLVHPRQVARSGAPSRDMMQRVLDGLHRL